jgi:hypothetical protein
VSRAVATLPIPVSLCRRRLAVLHLHESTTSSSGLGSSLASGTVDPAAYSNNYTDVNLGSVPGVPPNYGGVAFRALEPNTLYITGGANSAAGALYKIGVLARHEQARHGFVGTAVQVATAAHNDGGLQFGPSDVAFYTRYPNHELGQIKLGSTATTRSPRSRP